MNWNEQGGAAFPFAATDQSNVELQTSGMSLRDWFAGQALAGDTANSAGDSSWLNDTDMAHLESRAKLMYRLADAMLEARK